MNAIARRIATTVAAVATASLAAVSFGAPANAATSMVSGNGQATVLLTAQESGWFASNDGLNTEHTCGVITYDVAVQRQAAGAGTPMDYYTCLDIMRACVSQVPTNTQVNIWADSSYSCSSYSTDGSLASKIAGMLVP